MVVVHVGFARWLYMLVVHGGCAWWLYMLVVHVGGARCVTSSTDHYYETTGL